MNKFAPKHHQTHQESFLRFIILICLVVAYFFYMSWKFDAVTGSWIALLSWTFFVLCTPIADGGFVVAFPLRLLFGIRMVVTQAVVWFIAVAINVYSVYALPSYYSHSEITKLLYTIITTVWPYWSILLISVAGTALSIWFGDEMMDVTSHVSRKKYHQHGFKHKILITFGFGVLTILAYYKLLSDLGVQVPG